MCHKLASQAASWYNTEVNIVLPERCYQHRQALINLCRRLIVNTLPLHASNGNQITSKYCSGCNQVLDIARFNRNRSRPDGFEFRCRKCTNAVRNEYRKTHPQKPDAPEYKKIRLERQRQKREILVTKLCSECNNPYQDRNGSGKICPECKVVRRKQFRPQTFLICQHCGEQFGPADHLKVQYCSKECAYKAISLRPSPQRGKTYPNKQKAPRENCPSCGRLFAAKSGPNRQRRKYCSHACYLKERRVSHFEMRVMDLIESMGVPVERQVRRGKWSFDAAIPNTTILIEADGAFWHSPKHVQERDARKDQWCKDNGYTLMRVPELAFYGNPVETVMPIITRWEAHTGQTATLLERVEEVTHA